MKPSNQAKIGLMGKRLIEEPWTMVAADIMGPLPLSKKGKNQYIFMFVDLFTKWVEIIPIVTIYYYLIVGNLTTFNLLNNLIII